MRSLGIDVGGSRKKLDLVLLDERRQPFPVLSRVAVEELPRLIEELRPDVVAIDSPPDWGQEGMASRETERQLAMPRLAMPGKPEPGIVPETFCTRGTGSWSAAGTSSPWSS